MIKTTLRWLKSAQNWRDCQGSCLIEGICHILNYCCMMWKKKRCFICHHAEKLAIAFRRISRTSGTPLWLIEIMWVCEDCLFHKVHFKNIWENNHDEGSQLLSSLWGWCLFLHGLLVMLVVCLVNNYIKFVLFVACLMVSFHHYSWTLLSDWLSDAVPLKKWQWSILVVLISCLYHWYHLGLVCLSVWSYSENWVEFETNNIS